ncbi:class II aldolase/adducin family protein [Aquincola sp. S2]|uniref:Class II aldolase/adducin family protein n=1 Tax=Pseudaquabacterium terrae TaxID=2732868 RepID=A0ABX2ETK1_9BURK|nr:class II aldolase/adducin family protein [Aquabacterium terrae]NRF72077.1 class II aldolase/adducin family protein [Aquabacterium terrae]
MTPDQDLAVRGEIVDALQSMARLGINKGTAGNISVRAQHGFYISPTGLPYEGMTPDKIVLVHWNGSFEGEVLPSSEWQFHREILAERPELNAVVHTHSTNATAVSILERPIPAIHYVIAGAGGNNIPCAKYETFGSEELARSIVTAMRGRRACLIAHHGTVAAGVTLAKAMNLAVTVEELATLYLACLPFGEPPTLSDEEMDRVLRKYGTYGQQPASRAG